MVVRISLPSFLNLFDERRLVAMPGVQALNWSIIPRTQSFSSDQMTLTVFSIASASCNS